MTDYTKSTNFATKDSLLSGNPLKIVKGTELDTEFNNIATSIATKADLASPALTGSPTAPTASAGTSSTQIATTAFLATLYPVGTVYTNISDSTNPGTLFGFGTWVAITGRVIVGLDSGDTSFDTAGETGGSKDAIVVSHTHTVTDTGHSHKWGSSPTISRAAGSAGQYDGTGSTQNDTSTATTGISIDSTGSSATNANLQPYVVAYVWKRTA
jgi:hypothetical protein